MNINFSLKQNYTLYNKKCSFTSKIATQKNKLLTSKGSNHLAYLTQVLANINQIIQILMRYQVIEFCKDQLLNQQQKKNRFKKLNQSGYSYRFQYAQNKIVTHSDISSEEQKNYKHIDRQFIKNQSLNYLFNLQLIQHLVKYQMQNGQNKIFFPRLKLKYFLCNPQSQQRRIITNPLSLIYWGLGLTEEPLSLIQKLTSTQTPNNNDECEQQDSLDPTFNLLPIMQSQKSRMQKINGLSNEYAKQFLKLNGFQDQLAKHNQGKVLFLKYKANKNNYFYENLNQFVALYNTTVVIYQIITKQYLNIFKFLQKYASTQNLRFQNQSFINVKAYLVELCLSSPKPLWQILIEAFSVLSRYQYIVEKIKIQVNKLTYLSFQWLKKQLVQSPVLVFKISKRSYIIQNLTHQSQSILKLSCYRVRRKMMVSLMASRQYFNKKHKKSDKNFYQYITKENYKLISKQYQSKIKIQELTQENKLYLKTENEFLTLIQEILHCIKNKQQLTPKYKKQMLYLLAKVVRQSIVNQRNLERIQVKIQKKDPKLFSKQQKNVKPQDKQSKINQKMEEQQQSEMKIILLFLLQAFILSIQCMKLIFQELQELYNNEGNQNLQMIKHIQKYSQNLHKFNSKSISFSELQKLDLKFIITYLQGQFIMTQQQIEDHNKEISEISRLISKKIQEQQQPLSEFQNQLMLLLQDQNQNQNSLFGLNFLEKARRLVKCKIKKLRKSDSDKQSLLKQIQRYLSKNIVKQTLKQSGLDPIEFISYSYVQQSQQNTTLFQQNDAQQ